MASRTPVAQKTALARKLSGKYAVELNNIKSIADGYAGKLPKPVMDVINSNPNNVKLAKARNLSLVGSYFEQMKAGNWECIHNYNRTVTLYSRGW